MYEVAVSVISEYMDEYLFEPAANWPEEEFFERSCSRWVANEILARINDEDMLLPQHVTGREYQSPLGIIHEFINELIYFTEISENAYHQNMFSIATETAIDIILLFL